MSILYPKKKKKKKFTKGPLLVIRGGSREKVEVVDKEVVLMVH